MCETQKKDLVFRIGPKRNYFASLDLFLFFLVLKNISMPKWFERKLKISYIAPPPLDIVNPNLV